MPNGLFIDVTQYCPFTPDVADSHVLVYLDEAQKRREINIWINPELTENQITSVLSVLNRFFESDQFRSIDFDACKMKVRHRGRDDAATFVQADEGSLCEDGVVEFLYDPPHK